MPVCLTRRQPNLAGRYATQMEQSGIEVRMAHTYIIQLVGELAHIQVLVFGQSFSISSNLHENSIHIPFYYYNKFLHILETM